MDAELCFDRRVVHRGFAITYGDYASLRDKYNHLVQQYSNLQEAHKKTIEKWRAGKEHIKSWQAYHERSKARREHAVGRERRQNLNPEVERTGPLNDGPERQPPLDKPPISSLPRPLVSCSPTEPPSLKQGHTKPNVEARHYREVFRVPDGLQQVMVEAEGASLNRRPTQASLDQGDETETEGPRIDELPAIQPHGVFPVPRKEVEQPDCGHSSDQPVVVSERSVKRRKRPSVVRTPNIVVNEDGQPGRSAAKPITVKSEQGSSSPLYATRLRESLVTQDSLDLDEVGARLVTPRKRRRLEELLRLSQPGVSFLGTGVGIMGDIDADKKLSRHELGTDRNKASGQDEEEILDRPTKLSLEASRPANRRKRKAENLLPAPLDVTPRPKTPTKAVPSVAPNNTSKPKGRQRFDLRSFEADEQPIRCFSEPPDAGTTQRLAVGQLAAGRFGRAKALQPTDPNVQILPRTSARTSKLKRQVPPVRSKRVAERVPVVAEDGENTTGANVRYEAKSALRGLDETVGPSLGHDQNIPDLPVHNRLASLLDAPSPEKSLLSPTSPSSRVLKSRSRSPTRSAARPRKGEDRGQGLGMSAITAGSSTGGTIPTENHQNHREHYHVEEKSIKYQAPQSAVSYISPNSFDDSGIVLPDDEPLRARPLNRLGPDHFKINPDYNQGLDYAFNEVVRNHEQRKCLPGCTKDNCCGSKFRKLVEIGGLPTPRTSGLWSSSPPEHAEADQRLLAEYLGDDNHGRLAQMSEPEKRDLLLDAKTRYFADKHGRHRQAYERRSTPPGFWRTDMPTTQEVAEDRESARKMERRRVEEMYREAMRAGGRWMFRDE